MIVQRSLSTADAKLTSCRPKALHDPKQANAEPRELARSILPTAVASGPFTYPRSPDSSRTTAPAKLAVDSTPNQDSPISVGRTPVPGRRQTPDKIKRVSTRLAAYRASDREQLWGFRQPPLARDDR